MAAGLPSWRSRSCPVSVVFVPSPRLSPAATTTSNARTNRCRNRRQRRTASSAAVARHKCGGAGSNTGRLSVGREAEAAVPAAGNQPKKDQCKRGVQRSAGLHEPQAMNKNNSFVREVPEVPLSGSNQWQLAQENYALRSLAEKLQLELAASEERGRHYQNTVAELLAEDGTAPSQSHEVFTQN
mmetsp:Transcript_4371/g.8756  ORF Transcript_4371/g.8756 Transcript_4371/m.8756 type:complete len:184 (-) Transcript_4371:30-581(-)